MSGNARALTVHRFRSRRDRRRVVYVVSVAPVYRGPIRVGWDDQLPAFPALASDMTEVPDRERMGPYTHWIGAMRVRRASDDEARVRRSADRQ